VTLFVDTSVWSLALRRDAPADLPEITALANALAQGTDVVTTGLVLQELLQGFKGPRAREAIIERFAAVPLIIPDRRDHVDAAGIRNLCRRHGIQVGTIDVLLTQLCIRHDLQMLSTDRDFAHIAQHCSLRLWMAPAARNH
jgi:hypothetical protein